DNRGLVLSAFQNVAIEAVIADVDFSADKPLGVRLLPFKDLVPRLEPEQSLGLIGPESLRIVLGPLPELLVLGHRLDCGGPREIGGRWKNARLLEHARDIGSGRRG